MYYNKVGNFKCYNFSSNCKLYRISEDNGKTDDNIKLTSDTDSDSFLVNKENLADGYVISANKNIEIYFEEEGKPDELSGTVSDITKIKYFTSSENIPSMIKKAK